MTSAHDRDVVCQVAATNPDIKAAVACMDP